jgi:glucosamine--fructose-6-phosphate aminotransferase (isomerizing)
MSQLAREIQEQPMAIRRLLEAERGAAQRVAEVIHSRHIQHVVIAARGSSDNAARYAGYLFGTLNRLSVGLAMPSLFTLYGASPRLADTLVIGISQSGQSPDIVTVLTEGRRQGALTLAITNDLRSPLATEAEYGLNLHAGPELSVAATKTYTASLTALAMLAVNLAEDTDRLAELEGLPEAVAQTLALDKTAQATANRWRFADRCVVVGRGYNYATAYEIALKLKELTYIVAEPYSPADFLHGPVAMVERDFPALVIAPSGATLANVQALACDLRDAGAELLVISDAPAMLQLGQTSLALPDKVPEWLSPVTAAVAGQIFALRLAQAKGLDPDHPRGLQKVTRTH